MSKKQDENKNKNITEKLNEVYGDLEAEAFVGKLQLTGKNLKEGRKGNMTPVGVDLGDRGSGISASATYLPCPHCKELINLETYKGLFFDEYLNRLSKKDLKKLLAETLWEKAFPDSGKGGSEKEGHSSGKGGPNKEGQARNKEGQPLFTLKEFLNQLQYMKYHQPVYKEVKRILKAQGHWRDLKKGGSFKPGNAYRFTKNKTS